jgi:hypothetical protein
MPSPQTWPVRHSSCARAHSDGGLNTELPAHEHVAGAVNALLPRPAEGAQEIILFAAESQFTADIEQGGKHDALDQRPGVIVDLVREPGIAFCVGSREILDLRRFAVG